MDDSGRSLNQIIIDTRGKNSRTPEACKRYQMGRCLSGQNCTFLHVDGNQSKATSSLDGDSVSIIRKPCNLWDGKVCGYGPHCRFLHGEPAAGFGNNELLDQSGVRHDVNSNPRSESANAAPHGPYHGTANVSARDQVIYNSRRQSTTVDPNVPYTGIANVSPRDQISADEYHRENSLALHGEPAARFGRKGNWKTKICQEWKRTGECRYGMHCSFAHGINELRSRSGVQYEISNTRSGSVTADPHGTYRGTGNVDARERVISSSSKTSATTDPHGPSTATANIAARYKDMETRPINRKINGIYADWIDDETQL